MTTSTLTPATADTDPGTNPFLETSPLPYQLPPFDRIDNAHFAPAFAEAMRLHKAEVQAIATSAAPPTFDNTIVAMERSGRMLARVSSVFFNLTSAHTNDTLEAVERDVAPALAAHNDTIFMNRQLFARIDALHERRGELGLDPQSLRLVERYHADFVRAGARLQESDQQTLKALNSELAVLATAFSQNVLREQHARAVVVDDRAELAGLSDNDIAAAAEAAKSRGLDGKYVLVLTNTSDQPPQAQLASRAVRARLHQASLARGSSGEFDNRDIVLQLARLRAERARLLGYANHAAYTLEDETAQTVEAVNRLLAELAPAAMANVRREAAAIQAMIERDGDRFEPAAHDWAFYAERVRTERFDFDSSQLKPYFELNSVLHNGAFFAAQRLYGLRFERRHDLPVYHHDVQVYEVFEEDGTPLALFLTDFHARASKRGGAWMNEYVPQSTLLGTLPVVGNHMNIPQPADGEPTLLTYDEVITLFHEFGHALHGMLSAVRYPRFAGTNVPRDFVEFPSQVNEMWAAWPEVLKNYAKHYKTGEPMPQSLLDKVLAAQKFNQGFETVEYLAAALLDQRWHQLAPDEVPNDVLAFEAAALRDAGVDFAPVPPRYRSTYFSHIFSSGYEAGYYAYIWAAVIDADSVEWFRENGGLTRDNGTVFRRQLLSRGGSADAMALYRAFRGRDPDIAPLLARRGLDGV